MEQKLKLKLWHLLDQLVLQMNSSTKNNELNFYIKKIYFLFCKKYFTPQASFISEVKKYPPTTPRGDPT